MEKFVEKLKEMVIEAAEFGCIDEDERDEWADEFVHMYADELLEVAKKV